MGERESTARAQRDHLALSTSPTSPALRPVLDPEPWSPPQLTTGFAVGWALTLGVLGTITAVWLVGMVTVVVLLVLGQGGVGTVLAFAGTGVLLGRGWVGMAQTIRSRLRRRDLDDPAALPGTFATLSAPLQRLVRHTRSLAIVVRDPELPLAELDREMFEWISIVAKLPPEDRRMLEERGMGSAQLREDLVRSRWQEDQARRGAALHRRWLARGNGRGHRERAVAMLARLEHEVLRPMGDPFRGGGPRRGSS
ncbi:hypothetical protein [Paraliomyxa miuraensis]|uniref:hypothetical protein n=1 Tax=Paraliomyxa miuraensis TaxID=376150 RepID=UPI0022535C03|nr:hypothetical protein [Paraliomyxa miuraensis]